MCLCAVDPSAGEFERQDGIFFEGQVGDEVRILKNETHAVTNELGASRLAQRVDFHTIHRDGPSRRRIQTRQDVEEGGLARTRAPNEGGHPGTGIEGAVTDDRKQASLVGNLLPHATRTNHASHRGSLLGCIPATRGSRVFFLLSPIQSQWPIPALVFGHYRHLERTMVGSLFPRGEGTAKSVHAQPPRSARVGDRATGCPYRTFHQPTGLRQPGPAARGSSSPRRQATRRAWERRGRGC